jgi:hypothetical protein
LERTVAYWKFVTEDLPASDPWADHPYYASCVVCGAKVSNHTSDPNCTAWWTSKPTTIWSATPYPHEHTYPTPKMTFVEWWRLLLAGPYEIVVQQVTKHGWIWDIHTEDGQIGPGGERAICLTRDNAVRSADRWVSSWKRRSVGCGTTHRVQR